MAAGCGKVIISGACASCAMSSCSISARMASRGVASRAHSTRMRWIAALAGPGGSTGAIMRSLSARHCFFGGFLVPFILGRRRLGQRLICHYHGLLRGQRRLCRRRSAFGRLSAKLHACVIVQYFLLCGGLVAMLLVCLVAVSLLGVHLMMMSLVENGGIKLGQFCGGERRGKMIRRWSTVSQFGGEPRPWSAPLLPTL